MPTHPGFLKGLTGVDPFVRPVDAVVEAIRILDVDMLMCSIPEEITPQEEEDASLYDISYTKWRNDHTGQKDIYSYDPSVFRRNTPATLTVEQCVAAYKRVTDRNDKLAGEVALPIGYLFTTCIHYAAEDLDWPAFLMGCISDDRRILPLLDRFQETSSKLISAWSQTDIKVMLCHDDIAMKTGLLLSPIWLRKNLIPRYKILWEPLKRKGIKILFVSDGNYSEVARDIREAGADGFFLDTPTMDLERLVDQCGTDAIYFTGVSPLTMTSDTPQQIFHQMDHIAGAAQNLSRFFFHMVGSWPHNIPVVNVEAFYAACRKPRKTR